MELFIIIILLLIVIFYFRRFSSFVYAFALIDILLRMLNFIRIYTYKSVPELSHLLYKYFPTDLLSVVAKYIPSNTVLFVIIAWACLVLYVCFWFYNFKFFLKKGK